MSNENQWFYAVNDEQKDAVSTEELYNLFKQGVINDESLVWQENMAEWLPLSRVSVIQTKFQQMENMPQRKANNTIQEGKQYTDKTILYCIYACFVATVVPNFGIVFLITAILLAFISDNKTGSNLEQAHFSYIKKHSWIAMAGYIAIFLLLAYFLRKWQIREGATLSAIAYVVLDIYILISGIRGFAHLKENRLPKII